MDEEKIEIESFDFDKYTGKKFNFYGVDNNCFKLNDKVLEAIEDDTDGYRSMLGTIEVSGKGGIFFRLPIAKVIVKKVDDGDNDGYELIDSKDGHTWLSFGTNRSSSFYPCFYFNYQPKGKDDDE